ncbi:MAG: hypothetical protein MJE63_33790 [Proteobacteria bacterium]|nr:hypothetical protein [Pseudomonadota bacterium]
MKQLIHIALIVIFILGIHLSVIADDFDDLVGLSDETSVEETESGLDDLASDEDLGTGLAEEFNDVEEDSSGLTVSFGGYLKILGYWNEEKYSDALWEYYQGLAMAGHEIPKEQKLSGFNNVGTRMQVKVEGYLGDKARLFSAFNLNYNLAQSLHQNNSSNDEGDKSEIRMVESFVEIYDNSRTWKIGSQIVTWGYMEGFEVPTDRLNARDESYKSTEYEDSKLASTGVFLTQTISNQQLELIYIPVTKPNVAPEFTDYLYTGTDEDPEKKPDNSKWATRFVGSVGNLDITLSYIEGLDNDPDLNASGDAKVYNRVRSPGLDLQYNAGSFLAKFSGAYYYTEDTEGDDPDTKNHWGKYAAGVEFNIGGSTINLYAGQEVIANYDDSASAQSTNFLLGQLRERTDFVSGHINADFLTGNALNVVLMAAGYWDEEGEPVQSIYKMTLKYKIADGLDVLCSPMYVNYLESTFIDWQAEVKYSF